METTFQSLHHVDAIDASQCLADMHSISIFRTKFRFQKFDGTITGIVQMWLELIIRQDIQRIEESVTGVLIHFVL